MSEPSLYEEACQLVRKMAARFEQDITESEVDSAARKIVGSMPLFVRQRGCRHDGWSFARYGRGCPICGQILVDFGD